MGGSWAYPVGLRLSRLFHDAVGENDAADHVSRKLGTVELSPVALGLLSQLENHHHRRLARAATLCLPGAMTNRRKSRFYRIRRPDVHPMFGRKIVKT